MIEAASGRPVLWQYDEKNREGDHICYISDMQKFRSHYPGWSLTRKVADIVEEMVRAELAVAAS
jgi:CDP-paratose 2-epimerase